MPPLRRCASSCQPKARPGVSRPSRCSRRISSGRMSLVVSLPRCPRPLPKPPMIFSLRDLPKSFGKFALWFSPILAESLAVAGIAPVLMVSGFMRRAGLSASKAWPMSAQICGQGAFRSGSASPTVRLQPFAQGLRLDCRGKFGFLHHAIADRFQRIADEFGQPFGSCRVFLFLDMLIPPVAGFLNQRPPGFGVGIRPALAKYRRRLLGCSQIKRRVFWLSAISSGSSPAIPARRWSRSPCHAERCRRLDHRCRAIHRAFQSLVDLRAFGQQYPPLAPNDRGKLFDQVPLSHAAGRCSSISAASRSANSAWSSCANTASRRECRASWR
jgi:hypothetical protein